MLSKVVKCSLFMLLVLALALPPAFAEVSANERDVFESLSVLVIDGDQTISAQDAVVLRRGMDAYGDNNSHVSSLEVTNFEAAYEDFVKEFGNEYTLNGINGEFTSIVATFKDATGPTDSGDPILYEYNGRINFAGLDESLDSYKFRIVNEGGDLNSTMQISVTVPEGYEIIDTQGIYPADMAKDRGVSGHAITDTNVVITFAPADEWAWTYPLLLLSGLISAIIVAVIAIGHFRGGQSEEIYQQVEEPNRQADDTDPG